MAQHTPSVAHTLLALSGAPAALFATEMVMLSLGVSHIIFSTPHLDCLGPWSLARHLPAVVQAILALKRAQAVDPANGEVMLSLGVSYTNELDQRRAVQFLGAWLALHPSPGVRQVAQARPVRNRRVCVMSCGNETGFVGRKPTPSCIHVPRLWCAGSFK